MKKKIKNCLSAVLAVWMLLAICPAALAAEQKPDAAKSGTDHVLFVGLSSLGPGESIEYETVGPDGEKAVVGIERAGIRARSAGTNWRVWYTWLTTHIEFYMTVSNNKVTAVYDYSISLHDSSYEDASLTKTSTYGKLTFKHIPFGGFSASTCWLKGTVTGENDEIEVTWQM